MVLPKNLDEYTIAAKFIQEKYKESSSKDININFCCKSFGWTIFHFAVQHDNDLLFWLLNSFPEKGSKSSLLQTDGNQADIEIGYNTAGMKLLSPLHIAAQIGNNFAIKLLLDHYNNVNIGDESQKTALHHAVIKSNIETIGLLLQYNAPIDAVDHHRMTALDYAFKFLNIDVAILLLKHKAKSFNNPERLKFAINARSVELVKMILEQDIDLSMPIFNGRTALEFTLMQIQDKADLDPKSLNHIASLISAKLNKHTQAIHKEPEEKLEISPKGKENDTEGKTSFISKIKSQIFMNTKRGK